MKHTLRSLIILTIGLGVCLYPSTSHALKYDKRGNIQATTGIVVGDGSSLSGVTTSVGLASALSDETGSGSIVLGTSPTFTTQITTPIAYGSSAANGDVTIEGTSHATKTTSYVILQPTTGNVGINTSAPDASLHVAGTLHVTGAATFDSSLVFAGSNASTFGDGTSATYPITFNVSGTDHTMTAGSAAVTFSNTISAARVSGDVVVGKKVQLTDAATIATDAALGNTFTVTLGGNRTLGTPTNPVDGQRATWIISQDATGSRTLQAGPAFRFGSTVTSFDIGTTAGQQSYIGAIYNIRGPSQAAQSWDVVATAKGYAG